MLWIQSWGIRFKASPKRFKASKKLRDTIQSIRDALNSKHPEEIQSILKRFKAEGYIFKAEGYRFKASMQIFEISSNSPNPRSVYLSVELFDYATNVSSRGNMWSLHRRRAGTQPLTALTAVVSYRFQSASPAKQQRSLFYVSKTLLSLEYSWLVLTLELQLATTVYLSLVTLVSLLTSH